MKAIKSEINWVPQPRLIEQRLENGLRVILNPSFGRALVSVVVYYAVGARNEQPGETGFAHLFEHMMFQASRHVKKNEFFRHIETWGGTFNGNTTHERTVYYETLPADQLPLALWLESDRMDGLAVTEEHLRNQVETVKEERRLRYDNEPYMPAWLSFNESAYTQFANRHPVIGSMEDLEKSSLEQVTRFFRTYYRPNRAVLVIGGDFKPKAAMEWVKHYFAEIPPGPDPPPCMLNEPPLQGPITLSFEDPHAQLPGLLLGWRIPSWGDPDFYPLWLLHWILLEGRGAFLRRRFIQQEPLLVDIYGIFDGRRGPGLLSFLAILPQEQLPANTVRVIEEALLDWSQRITPEEFERARRIFVLNLLRNWQNVLDPVLDLGESTVLDGSPHRFFEDIREMFRVEVEKVREVVPRYLTPENRIAALIQPIRKGKS